MNRKSGDLAICEWNQDIEEWVAFMDAPPKGYVEELEKRNRELWEENDNLRMILATERTAKIIEEIKKNRK